MQVLVAEDDPHQQRLLCSLLERAGHQVQTTDNGLEALATLRGERGPAPRLALLDWVMPGMVGPEVCRQLRGRATLDPPYLLLVSSCNGRDEILIGLQSGANDYIIKPYNKAELAARLAIGIRMLDLQAKLGERVRELEQALQENRSLRGLLPICCYCKRIRNDRSYWQEVEQYIADNSEATFSHGICPDCYKQHIERELAELRGEEGPTLTGDSAHEG